MYALKNPQLASKRIHFTVEISFLAVEFKHNISQQDCIAAKQGDCIYGNFSMKPNKNNERDLDINIKVSFKSEDSSLEEDNNYTMR